MSQELNPCPYCTSPTERSVRSLTKDRDGIDLEEQTHTCLLCGYSVEYRFADLVTVSRTGLKAFDLSSTEVGLAELGTHLRRNWPDIYRLHPRRFEELVADVFRDHNREPVLTKETRDGGVDVFLINRQTQQIDAIIEAKRYAPTRRVGIAVIERLAGVALKWDAKRAYLVTTSDVSRPGRSAAVSISQQGVVELDLVAASELLLMLGVYNRKLPRLEDLTPEIRSEIVAANRQSGGGAV